MKKTLVLVLVLLSSICLAEKRAVTSTGEEVILSDNGTWKFLKPQDTSASKIETNPKEFVKDPSATFPVTSKINNATVFIDPNVWSFTSKTPKPEHEYFFTLKGKEFWGTIINEKTEVPIETIAKLSVEYLTGTLEDLEIMKKEYRIVNGKKVISMLLKGSANGLKLTYHYYFCSGPNGSIQFVVFSSQKLFPEFAEAGEKFLNGLNP